MYITLHYITKLPLDTSPLNNNAWLSGFIEKSFLNTFNAIFEAAKPYYKDLLFNTLIYYKLEKETSRFFKVHFDIYNRNIPLIYYNPEVSNCRRRVLRRFSTLASIASPTKRAILSSGNGYKDLSGLGGPSQSGASVVVSGADLSLVIWGKNLSSTVGSKFTLNQLSMVRLAPYPYSVIIGLLLSDGGISFSSKNSKNGRLHFKQSINKANYLWFVFNILSHYCSRGPQLITNIRLGKKHNALYFFSRTMPCITELYYLFYSKGVKKVPNNIYDLLTPVAIAHSIMGDGSSTSAGGIRIGTDSFSVKDCIKLVNVLIIRYNISTTIQIQKNGTPRLYIGIRSKELLIPLVKPHMVPSMYYKLGKNLSVTYLSKNIKVSQHKCFSTLSCVRLNRVYPDQLSSSYSLGLGYLQNNVSAELGSYLEFYLAGLIEANGHFNIPKERYDPSLPFPSGDHIKSPRRLRKLKGGKGFPQGPLSFSRGRLISIEVIFLIKDQPLAELLRAKLGGNLYSQPNNNFVRWVIEEIKSLSNILNIINGKLRTPKINSFYNMIDLLKGVNNALPPLLDTSPVNQNAWLAGFIDGKGHFAIKGFSSNPTRGWGGIQFQLSQRNTDKSGESLEKIMLKITEFLLVKLNSRTLSEKYRQFVISTSNRVSNNILIDYLNTYPLLSSKYLDFKDWQTAHNIYTNKLHKDPIQLEKIRELKVNMNNGRTYFSWSHHKHLLP